MPIKKKLEIALGAGAPSALLCAAYARKAPSFASLKTPPLHWGFFAEGALLALTLYCIWNYMLQGGSAEAAPDAKLSAKAFFLGLARLAGIFAAFLAGLFAVRLLLQRQLPEAWSAIAGVPFGLYLRAAVPPCAVRFWSLLPIPRLEAPANEWIGYSCATAFLAYVTGVFLVMLAS